MNFAWRVKNFVGNFDEYHELNFSIKDSNKLFLQYQNQKDFQKLNKIVTFLTKFLTTKVTKISPGSQSTVYYSFYAIFK